MRGGGRLLGDTGHRLLGRPSIAPGRAGRSGERVMEPGAGASARSDAMALCPPWRGRSRARSLAGRSLRP
jgi:hypothetical protein